MVKKCIKTTFTGRKTIEKRFTDIKNEKITYYFIKFKEKWY